jgi:hypothetical protein
MAETYEFGEGRTFVVPARLETAEDAVLGVDGRTGIEAWSSSVITDAAQLGRQIALRQALRDQPRSKVSLIPTFPILGLERGITVRLDEVAWTVFGNDRRIAAHLSGNLNWRIEGFSVGARRDRSGSWQPIAGTIELESVSS